VILEIVDNYIGIDKKDVTRLFKPFFTTKATGVDTGLGLSVVRQNVKFHGGEITI
jgi:signal transduction histidine kinase